MARLNWVAAGLLALGSACSVVDSPDDAMTSADDGADGLDDGDDGDGATSVASADEGNDDGFVECQSSAECGSSCSECIDNMCVETDGCCAARPFDEYGFRCSPPEPEDSGDEGPGDDGPGDDGDSGDGDSDTGGSDTAGSDTGGTDTGGTDTAGDSDTGTPE